MSQVVLNEPLPYVWDSTDEGRETSQSDQRWLGGIIASAAPFSDWWAKARLVQLAYVPMYNADPTVYQGLSSPAAIVQQLYQELFAYANLRDPAQLQDQYPGLASQLDEAFVIQTLNSWKDKQFTQAISRNFEIYAYTGRRDGRRDRCYNKTFLVVSTAPVSLSAPRVLPDPMAYRPLFNVEELAQIIHDRQVRYITLRTHGYANPAKGFYKYLAQEADELFADPHTKDHPFDTLSDDHFYIGYHWPSEAPIFNAGLLKDSFSNVEILFKFLFSLFLVSLIPSAVVIGLSELLEWLGVVARVGPPWYLIITLGVFVLWLSLFSLLRAVVYLRDRYRALHYGAPDLAEFFWRLDKRLKALTEQEMGARASQAITQQAIARNRKQVNLVGHSMGGLVLVNVLRVLSDRFGKDDLTAYQDALMGECLSLGNLILASPDIPLELLREGRNNYVRSAIRRCQQIFLLSSDRDIVLRYLSTLGNWFIEPSIQMSGLRLGNLYLPDNPQRAIQQVASKKRRRKRKERLKILLIRGAIFARSAVRPTSAYDLFENFNYFDCSLMKGVNGVPLPLNPWTALIIDFLNTILFLTERLDVHGGYFFTETPTFKLLPFLMQADSPTEADIREQLRRWDPQSKMIRFLYRMTPTPGSKEAGAESIIDETVDDEQALP